MVSLAATLPGIVAARPIAASSTPSRAATDDHDEEAFFDSLPPTDDPFSPSADLGDLDAPPPAPEPLSPAALRRQLALRKAVSAVLGMAAALAMGMGMKTAAASLHRPAPAPAVVVTQPASVAANQLAALPATRPTEAARPAAVQPAALPVDRAPAVAASLAEVQPSAPPTLAAPSAPEPPAPTALDASPAPATAPSEAPRPDPAQAKDLTRQALSLLERGKMRDAIEKATASVEADPTDAAPYLYWGTALMELGKHKEAKAIFARCVDQATRGPKSECRQFR